MFSLSNFTSVLEIGFGINAVLVFLELIPFFDNYFKKKVMNLGENEINIYVSEKERKIIRSYGWRSLGFGYYLWLSRLKGISIFSSCFSLLLLIISGIFPQFTFGITFLIIMLGVIFIPIISITLIIVYALPYYKLACIKKATEELLENEKNKLNEQEFTKKKATFEALIKFIEFTNFPSIFMHKNRKNLKETMSFLNDLHEYEKDK